MPQIADLTQLTQIFGSTTAVLIVVCYLLSKVVQEQYRGNQKLVSDMMESTRLRSEREALTNSALQELRNDLSHGHDRIMDAIKERRT